MGRPAVTALTPAQAESVAALYRETRQHEAWLRANVPAVRFNVYLGDAQQAIAVLRRNASEGRALLDVEAGGAWDEATGALRNAAHAVTRTGAALSPAQSEALASARAQVSGLLREAGAVLASREAEDAAADEAYRVAQFARNAGRARFQVAGRDF